jgi:hypothetical protein
MPRSKQSQDTSILSMALVGYELEKKKIEERIKEIRAQLSGKSVSSPNGHGPAKRRLSAAARKRIAAAQKKRWAEHRKAAAQAAKAG